MLGVWNSLAVGPLGTMAAPRSHFPAADLADLARDSDRPSNTRCRQMCDFCVAFSASFLVRFFFV